LKPDHRGNGLAVAALLAGAAAIATAPLFVKVSETGPVATAFWRIALALPLLWVWAAVEQRGALASGFAAQRGLIVVAGLLFAGDLAVWHWSIVLTSVANATLLANLAPIFVTLAVWALWGRRPRVLFLAGLATALAGVTALIGGNVRLGGSVLLGDALGVVTAMFYAAYQLAVTKLRESVATSTLMAWSGIFMALPLLAIALATGEQVLPDTGAGWLKLAALAVIAQAIGQSLIAWAMAHLPATLSSIGLLLQPVMATLYAWVFLGETLGAVAIAGAVAVLAGIRIAQRAEFGVAGKA
jgi:drug/metabolite transporter (DMT)-like permease